VSIQEAKGSAGSQSVNTTAGADYCFTVSREDWSLYRKGNIDQQRHRQKVQQAIRNNLAEVICEENIIMSKEQKAIRVPVRALVEYRFKFNTDKKSHVGQGNGKTKVGNVLGTEVHYGRRKGRGAGRQSGRDYHEVDVTVDELTDLVFEDLQLPNLKRKTKPKMKHESVAFKDIRKKGIQGNIDRRRTFLANIKRNALAGKPGLSSISLEDMRFKVWEESVKEESNAVVLVMMDISGSMGPFEKYIARSFFFWAVKFLRKNYKSLEIVFLAHHTEAKEVSEDQFYTMGESGGTRCSSVYRLALDIIDKRYSPGEYNIYAFHFSDGDNLASDNELCVDLVNQLLERANLVGYGEIEGPYYYTSTLLTSLKKIRDPRFTTVSIRDKSGVHTALKKFFGRERPEGAGHYK